MSCFELSARVREDTEVVLAVANMSLEPNDDIAVKIISRWNKYLNSRHYDFF